MRSTMLITGALAVAATSSLFGLGTAAYAGEPTTTNEKGIVLECSGTWRGKDVYASVYENNTYGNTVQIVIADGDVAGGVRETTRAFKDGRDVRAVMQLKGKRAVVQGTARAVGTKTRVHEEHDDAGQHITIDGTHRRLANDLTLSWKGTTVPLDCDTAFVYDLQVTKVSTVD
jgi:hypothetical protein